MSNILHRNLPNNDIGGHISLKYIAYERKATADVIESVVERLTKEFFDEQIKPIEVNRFCYFSPTCGYQKGGCYLSVINPNYLTGLHFRAIDAIGNLGDKFILNDGTSFIPHISCGKIGDTRIIKTLNEQLMKIDTKPVIRDWYLAVHTSSAEYIIR